MEANVEQAVAIALDPSADPNLRAQATAFCEQLRASSDGWQVCLKLFVKAPRSSDHTRFFSLQILEDLLQNRFGNLSSTQRATLRQQLWGHLKEGMDRNEPAFIRNKFVQVLVLLFANEYPEEWPTFFDDLLSLVDASKGGPRGSIIIDVFLRVSLAIDDEIANQLIARHASRVARNTLLKDVMREGAVAKLVAAWGDILMSSYQNNPDVANACLQLFGRYVSWIDINLVANASFMSALYQFIGEENLRQSACECLTEIIAKGMAPLDKLNLIQGLNVASVLGGFDTSDSDFVEVAARLVNVLGLELCRCWEETGSVPEAQEAAFSLLQQVFPYLVQYLAFEYDEVTQGLLHFLGSYLNVLKKLGRDQQTGGISDNLLALLRTIILKMKYDEEEDHQFGGDAGSIDAEFIKLRENLKPHFDAIGAIDKSLFISNVTSAVVGIFDRYAENSGGMSWSEAELALHLVYIVGESTQGTGQFLSEGPSPQPAPLAEMLTKMITSGISLYPHLSISSLFCENLARYPQFFDHFPQYLPNALEAFVDQRGLHHDKIAIRSRVYYLFSQFVRATKAKLAPFVETVLNSIQDLLVVQLPAPRVPPADGEDEATSVTFDSQLYVFEAAGMMISLDAISPEKQADLLTAVLTPLMMQMEEIMKNELYLRDSPPDNVVFTLQLNHIICAIGSTSKGFPDVVSGKATRTVPPWALVFQQALDVIAAVLERLHNSELIRDAARFAFQRMVHSMGTNIMNHVGPLITAGLWNNSTPKELLDFLPFLGLITHKFKPGVFPLLNELVGPLLTSIFASLNQPVEGTDDAFSRLELRKAYLNFLAQVFNSDMEGILLTERNMPQLNMVLQSVLHFFKEPADSASQKLACSVLVKCVISWGTAEGNTIKITKTGKALKPDKSKTTSPALPRQQSNPSTLGTADSDPSLHQQQPQSLPGFEQFMYENIVPILFEVPLNPQFDPNDGQNWLVMSEISALHCALFMAQGAKYVDFLRARYLPTLGFDPAASEAFLRELQVKDSRGLKPILTEFIKLYKKQRR
ncbi:armadillo-type protein [Fimicolochytrium jonesii]|uniref:armadillo-type protein n=1 Tax=Fimicolochytrium jonesii TaxID=1396493 RepID=UPI0022FEA9D6|nr:armadillo-type protein [Fimicolochytrium jonesii]KAI8815711.1 armadillo-type protein [Fimicolochytrium jonesii]